MRRTIFGLLSLLGVALAAAPASAVNVTGCGEFIIFAKDDIIFENGLTMLTGDIYVQSPTGQVKVGSNNILHGTVSAHKIIVGNGAVVDHCAADTIELLGTGTCTTSSLFSPQPAACTAAFPPPPLTVPVFPAQCVPGTAVVVAQGDTDDTLAPGCYASMRLNKNSKLTLNPGGTYFVKGETRQLAGSTLIGGAGKPDAAAIVNIAGNFVTENGVFMTNLLLNITSSGGQAVQIFNNSLLQDVVVNAPNGNVHPHTGTQLRGATELVGKTFHDIQPITNEVKPPTFVCECGPGLKFLLTTPVSADDRVCVPINPQ